jgi:hypothetical protein
VLGFTNKPPNKISGIIITGAIVVATTILSAIALILNPMPAPHYTKSSRDKYYIQNDSADLLKPRPKYTVS